MLPREVVEELAGRPAATGFHILVALADAFDGLLVVLTFPLEIVRQNVVQCVSRTCSASRTISSVESRCSDCRINAKC